MDTTEDQSSSQTSDLYSGAAAEAPAPAASGGDAAPASAEALPAAAGDAYGGPSQINAAASTPDTSAEDQKKNEDDLEALYKSGKNLVKGKGGGVDALKDAYGEGKSAVTAFQEGRYGDAVSDGFKAAGDAVSVVNKPIGAGLKAGAQASEIGDRGIAQNETIQGGLQSVGLNNADGSKTSYTDALRNAGDKVGGAVGDFTGNETLGKAAGVATKVGGAVLTAVPAAAIGVVSSGAKTGYNWLKNKYNSLRGE
jgi:hypothetical protein